MQGTGSGDTREGGQETEESDEVTGLEEPQRRRVVSASRVRSGWTRTAPRASEAPAAEAAAGDSATSREVTSLTRARTAVSSPAPWLPVSRRLAQTETNSLTLSDSNA